MPKKEIDFTKCVIYKIVCNDLNIKELYVGSTTDFTKRKSQHKSTCSYDIGPSFHLKLYKMIRLNGGWDNWNMYEIEKYPCNDSNEARTRERYWFEMLQATLNSVFHMRTKKEYNEVNKNIAIERYKENKEEILEKMKYYRDNNKDKINIQKREYYINNKDNIIEKQHEYYENNKSDVIEYNKNYYMDNKQKIADRSKNYREINKDVLSDKHQKYYEANKFIESCITI